MIFTKGKVCVGAHLKALGIVVWILGQEFTTARVVKVGYIVRH